MAGSFNIIDFVNPLQQFVLLSKTAKGAAAVELIKQVLDTDSVFSFGLLLNVPNIMALADGPYSGYYNLLKIFAYGTYNDYLKQKSELPDLSPAQTKKLRMLTIVSAATNDKYVAYSSLLKDIEINSIRDLEDLIMETMYVELIQGKLDQKDSRLEVNFCVGRDFKPEELTTIISEMDAWSETVGSILHDIKTEIRKTLKEKHEFNAHKIELDNKISEVKKQVKLQVQDESMLTDRSDSLTLLFEKSCKKKPKHVKAPRNFLPR